MWSSLPFLNFPTQVWTSHHAVSLWLDNAGPQQTCLVCGSRRGTGAQGGKQEITWSLGASLVCVSPVRLYRGILCFRKLLQTVHGAERHCHHTSVIKSRCDSGPWPYISWLDGLAEFAVDSPDPIIGVMRTTKSSLSAVNGKLWKRSEFAHGNTALIYASIETN